MVFPSVPGDATHWQVFVDGVAKQLVPVDRADYWLTGLTNGRSYALTLAGVSVAGAASSAGPATSGTAVPLAAPWSPYVSARTGVVTVRLPSTAPIGAAGWRLTVGGVVRDLPIGTAGSEFAGLPPGSPVGWELRAFAGSWADGPGSLTPPARGSITP